MRRRTGELKLTGFSSNSGFPCAPGQAADIAYTAAQYVMGRYMLKLTV
jgi:hypothetical protein